MAATPDYPNRTLNISLTQDCFQKELNIMFQIAKMFGGNKNLMKNYRNEKLKHH